MTNAYADLTTLKSSGMLNITGTGSDARLLALLEDVSRWIDGHCNRHFYVLETTRTFNGGGLELLVPDLISITSLKTDENRDRVYELTWAGGDYLLYPLNAEPQQPWGRPYSRVLVDTQTGTKAAFPNGNSVVEIVGKWGFREVVEDSGADINEGGVFGSADTTLTVTDGAKFSVGQSLLIESEQLYVTAITANDLTVERGINGTLAVVHPDGADVSLYRYPGSVLEACLLLASRLWLSRGSDPGRLPSVEPSEEVLRLLSAYRRLATGVGV